MIANRATHIPSQSIPLYLSVSRTKRSPENVTLVDTDCFDWGAIIDRTVRHTAYEDSRIRTFVLWNRSLPFSQFATSRKSIEIESLQFYAQLEFVLHIFELESYNQQINSKFLRSCLGYSIYFPLIITSWLWRMHRAFCVCSECV